MNDRFKFRVWDKGNKRYQGTQDWQPYLDTDGDVCFINTDDVRNYPPENYFIIEQCTGLKDNCGNLIYEGDIIGDGEDDYVIKWDSNRTMFVAEDVDTSYEIEDVLDPTICVIGNVHEQAEQKDVK